MIVALVASIAHAGGFAYPDSGIIANGRGCTTIAGSDAGQFGQYYNPATLIHVTRPTFDIGFSGVKQAITYDPLDATGAPLPQVVNEGGMFTVPEAGFATPIGPKVAFAFGFTSPFAPDYRFEPDGPQRYAIIDTLVWNFQVGPAVAVRPIDQLTIGVGLQWQVIRIDDSLKVTTRGDVDPSGDVLVEASVLDKFTPGLNAGVLVEPIPMLSIGASVQPPLKFHAHGKGDLDFTDWGGASLLDQTVYKDDDLGLALSLPWFIRGGVAVRPIDGLELEGDLVYETWSVLTDIQVSDIDVHVTGANGAIDNQVPDTLSLPAGFHDTWSARLGGEYDITDWLTWRAGGFYEASSLAPERVSMSLVDSPKLMLGTGASLHLLNDHLVLDAYVSHLSYKALKIRDSQVKQINVFDDQGPAAVVGNGDIRSWGLATGLAARVQWGKVHAQHAVQ